MSEDKDQAFVWKVKNGELNDIKTFVEKEGVDVNKAIQGRLPLHYAADYGQTEVIEYLISKGAKVNEPDKYGISPLLSAIFEGHTASVKLLLEKPKAEFKRDFFYPCFICIHASYALVGKASDEAKEVLKLQKLFDEGANKNEKSPEGIPYIECAEKDEIKALLK